MCLNNAGIRKTARFVNASAPSVLRWLKAARETLSRELNRAAAHVVDTMPDIIEMDEIDTFVKKTVPGSHWDCL
jgi:hypothetical protein